MDWDVLWESLLWQRKQEGPRCRGAVELNPGRARAGPQELSHKGRGQRMAVWATDRSLGLRPGPDSAFNSFWGLFSDQKKMG